MSNSIQEYCKKINRSLTFYDIGALLSVFMCLGILAAYIHVRQSSLVQDVVYQEASYQKSPLSEKNGLPFGSRNGATYTFSWCQGSGRIKEKNKIFFSSEEEAKKSGRVLSKLCER